MTSTQTVLTEFKKLVDANDTEFSLNELKTMLSDVYKTYNKKGSKSSTKKSNDDKKSPKEEKQKREPSAYNNFMKEQMPIFKAKNPDINARELMKEIGKLWKEQKETKE